MLRKVLFQIHLWSGLILALPFLVLGITGAFLVFDQDIDRALNPLKPPIASVGNVQSYDAITAAGLTGAKGVRVATVIAPEKPGAPAQVRLQKQGGGRAGGPPAREQTTAWVDPVDLSLLRVDPPRVSPFRWVHHLHGSFLIEGGLGRPLVGWAGVAMFIMGLSGLVLWWPKRGRWLSAFGIAKNARGYRFHRDLHGAAGIWLWAAFVAVTFTGVYISFPQSMGPAVSSVLPGRDLRATPELPGAKREGGGMKLSFDAIYAAAHKAVPDGSLVSIAAPARPGQVARVSLTQPGWHEGAPSITVFVNPETAEVMDVRDPRKFSVGESIQAWQRPLHEGIGLGIVWKILAFMTGLLPPLFVITGTYMWLVKRNNKRRAKADAPADAALEDA
jgi:uncharacterized iron-regulated membrane protein